MSLYDNVIHVHSSETIKYILSGILLVIILDYFMRNIRQRIFTWFGTRLASITVPQLFEKMISLPSKQAESGILSYQLSRLKDFDGIRNFFTGSLILTMMEIPFSFIMLFAVYLIGGVLVVIPCIFITIFIILFFLLMPMVRDSVQHHALNDSKRHNMTVNTLKKIKFLKIMGNIKPWMEQIRLVSGTSSHTNLPFISAVLEAIGYSMYVISGFSTMWFGVTLVIGDTISSGALIASMLLIWRLLAPFQVCLSSISVFIHLKKSIVQTHNLLMVTLESEKLKHHAVFPSEITSISLSNVFLKHYNHPVVIFNGLNLTIEAGELFMLTGRNGSGKTTFLKMLNGLYQPQAGSIRLKDTDLRQFDMTEYRRHIGYVPEKPDLFYGTIAQNLHIANPEASVETIVETLKMLGCYEDILSYSRGLNHHVEEFKSDELPDTLKFQISLARAILRDPTIMLIDEAPHSYVTSPTNQHLIDFLQAWKKQKTVVMVTKSERILRMADRVMFLLGDGRCVVGKPDEIINFINKQSNFKFE
jgi:ATP-binding cassette subfamily C protein LapB